MDGKFEVVVHHRGDFSDFTHSSYHGMEDTWICDPDVWSYFEVLGDLKEMGYINLESLWYYDPLHVDEIIRLRYHVGENRMKSIAYDEGKVHLYVIHTLYEPVVEEYPTLQYFIQGLNAGGNVGPNVGEMEEEVVVDNGPNVVEMEELDVVEENGPDVVENGPINDTVHDMNGEPSNDTVDVDNGPISDIVVDKENGPSNASIPPVAINSEGEGVDAINTKRVDVELRDNSEEDSDVGSTFDSEDEIALDDYFDDFATQHEPSHNTEPEPEPSLNPNSHTVLTDIPSQTAQIDIP